jgi:GTP cyclohydrolase II
MSPHLQSANCLLRTEFGVFRLHGFKDARTGLEHAALQVGNVSDSTPVLTRIHSECLTGDVFHSLHCDCGPQLHLALRTIAAGGRGVLLYLRQEGRGIGLVNKIRAYALQQAGADTVDANRLLGLPDDARDYAIAAEILQAMGIRDVHLMTNNPAKVAGLAAHGVRVSERVALETPRTVDNGAYLDTKAQRMGHLLSTLVEPGPNPLDESLPEGEVFCLSRRD